MAMARYINESGATVVSIDIPSGMYSDWNTRVLARNVVHADLTIAVQFPRLAFFLSDNAELVGKWKTVDIGLSRRAIEQTQTKYFLIEKDDVRRCSSAVPNSAPSPISAMPSSSPAATA